MASRPKVLSEINDDCMKLSLLTILAIALTAKAELPPQTRSFIEKHCVDCHDADTKKGGLDLTALTADLNDTATFSAWVKVNDRVRDGEMPPKKKQQPDVTEKGALLSSLAADLQRADATRQASEGRVVFRRLNRVKYEYTLRDLFSLPQLDVKEMLPSDAEAHGFDNIGAALTMSDVQMSRYLDAADAALDEALKLGPRAESEKQHIAALDDHGLNLALGNKKGGKVHGAKIGNAIGLLRQAAAGQHPWTWKSFEPMADGDYKLRTKTFGFMWEEGKVRPAGQPHVISYYARMGTNRRWLASCDVPADEAHAVVAEVTVHLRQGEQLELYLASLDTRNPKSLAEHTGPGIAIEWLETEGPLNQAPRFFGTMPAALWTPASGLVEPPAPSEVIKSGKRAKQRKNDSAPRYMVVSLEPMKDAERLLRGFMERAFRRPIPAGEVERYLALVRAKLDAKFCFQEALRTGLKAVLCSPDFLFFQETPGRLDDYALASRLSYFLWSSVPDEPLLALAKNGALHQPETLRAQVERLLSDAKSQRFVENFVGQWLDLRNIRATEPDEQLYPEFDELLCDSMLRETHAFFDDMLRRDLSATHLVASDFAMVNGRLATLYGISNVEGLAIRRVPLPKDSPRGGLLTQASILKVSANGTTTSPITRGAWVLKNLLGRPAPPPPPGIPSIEPDVRGATTVREQLAAHRSVESCALCHAKIDPPGFALESFDVMGGWRDRYRSLGDGDKVNAMFRGRPVDYRLGPRVDASGELASGAKFKGIADFRQLLLASQDQLARNLTSKLLVYATGAGVQFADRAEIESILTRAKPHDYGLRTLIHEIVQSKTFQQK
jgi:Protein of unknown function (DUF1592)/Protein of unknown function (DUF1588)/Protein of unknown function (DUF1585)/Protein of unknown function (DUF1587)/Protein of unknown function (DUF1595)/Planctomycete cytochrome C